MKYNKLYLILTKLLLIIGLSNNCHSGSFNQETGFIDLHYYSYEEPGLMTEKSRLPSFTIGYKNLNSLLNESSTHRISGTAEASFGLTKYSGSGLLDTNYIKFLGELYAPIYKTVYAGLGYRYLKDNMGGEYTSTGYWGYDRASQYIYIPIGFTLYTGNDGRLKAQYNYFLQGQQISYLSISGQLRDLYNKQNTGYGLDLAFTPTKGNWEVYIRYWNIDKSQVENIYYTNGSLYGTGWEPANKTFEVGYRLPF